MDVAMEDLRQQIADIAELTVLMRRRANLPRYTREWNEDRDAEERLIARIERWVQSSREAGDEYQSVVEAARGRRMPDPKVRG
jgi:hypothetical protein